MSSKISTSEKIKRVQNVICKNSFHFNLQKTSYNSTYSFKLKHDYYKTLVSEVVNGT